MFTVSPMYADALDRLNRYTSRHHLQIRDLLGSGYDGLVLATENSTALKAARYQHLYTNELSVYKRLREHGVGKIGRFAVPELAKFDDELWVIEMQIVSPPYVLDFATAKVDEKPQYTEEEMEQHEVEYEELFGENWAEVQSLLSGFRRYGIYLVDLHPRNIDFGNETAK